VFKIDPVFGALLSPTGGLVGPGNVSWNAASVPTDYFTGSPAVWAADTLLHRPEVAYHGIVHDAAGYLLNYHRIGPGYNYLGLDSVTPDTSNPLSGQQPGLNYWSRVFNQDQWKRAYGETINELDYAELLVSGGASVPALLAEEAVALSESLAFNIGVDFIEAVLSAKGDTRELQDEFGCTWEFRFGVKAETVHRGIGDLGYDITVYTPYIEYRHGVSG